MTTPTPSEAPLSAGAVPELPVVAWRCTQSIPDDGKRLNCVSSNAAYVAMHSAYNWQDLTPKAPAQATIHAQAAEIERLKRVAEAWKISYLQINSVVIALKAKQVAEVDDVMRLAQAYAQASSDLDESIRSRSRAPRMVNRHDLRVHVAFKAAREALRAALTKDRT